jgi:hypothetical protein
LRSASTRNRLRCLKRGRAVERGMLRTLARLVVVRLRVAAMHPPLGVVRWHAVVARR